MHRCRCFIAAWPIDLWGSARTPFRPKIELLKVLSINPRVGKEPFLVEAHHVATPKNHGGNTHRKKHNTSRLSVSAPRGTGCEERWNRKNPKTSPDGAWYENQGKKRDQRHHSAKHHANHWKAFDSVHRLPASKGHRRRSKTQRRTEGRRHGRS